MTIINANLNVLTSILMSPQSGGTIKLTIDSGAANDLKKLDVHLSEKDKALVYRHPDSHGHPDLPVLTLDYSQHGVTAVKVNQDKGSPNQIILELTLPDGSLQKSPVPIKTITDNITANKKTAGIDH